MSCLTGPCGIGGYPAPTDLDFAIATASGQEIRCSSVVMKGLAKFFETALASGFSVSETRLVTLQSRDEACQALSDWCHTGSCVIKDEYLLELLDLAQQVVCLSLVATVGDRVAHLVLSRTSSTRSGQIERLNQCAEVAAKYDLARVQKDCLRSLVRIVTGQHQTWPGCGSVELAEAVVALPDAPAAMIKLVPSLLPEPQAGPPYALAIEKVLAYLARHATMDEAKLVSAIAATDAKLLRYKGPSIDVEPKILRCVKALLAPGRSSGAPTAAVKERLEAPAVRAALHALLAAALA